MMEILVIGGRNFVGRHIVQELRNEETLTTNLKITLFNRGQTNPELFSDLELIRGDRNQDHQLLEGREWDVIIDTCGYSPRLVDPLARQLKTYTNHYIFISSCSVYNHHAHTNIIDEEAPIVDLEINLDDLSTNTYGARKYLCEKSIERHFKKNFTAIRPGLIVGAYDSTYRFLYWLQRLHEGGDVIAPGDPRAPVQFIDAADLAKWVVHIAKNRVFGTFNTCGPEQAFTMGGFLETVNMALGDKCKFTWLSDDFLASKKIEHWSNLPLWLPKNEWPFFRRNFSKAKQNGLTLRPFKETLKSSLDWLEEENFAEKKEQTLTRDREKELLTDWKIKSLESES